MAAVPEWISESDLRRAVLDFAGRAGSARAEANERMRKNVVDPFSSMITASTLGVASRDELMDIQRGASALGGIYNALGNFHQQVLGSVCGWANHDASYDLENADKRIIAEVKNKHNTMNSKNKSKVISDLEVALQTKGNGWRAYLVAIIPRKAKPYKIQMSPRRNIFAIDGMSFYAGVTGDPHALRRLLSATMDMLNSVGRPIPDDVASYCRETFDVCMPTDASVSRVEI